MYNGMDNSKQQCHLEFILRTFVRLYKNSQPWPGCYTPALTFFKGPSEICCLSEMLL